MQTLTDSMMIQMIVQILQAIQIKIEMVALIPMEMVILTPMDLGPLRKVQIFGLMIQLNGQIPMVMVTEIVPGEQTLTDVL
jgi:hypothetical protein